MQEKEMTPEEQEQFDALMAKADAVEKEESGLNFDQESVVNSAEPDLDFIANPNIIGDGLNPQMLKMMANQHLTRAEANGGRHPTKKRLTKAQRQWKRKAEKGSRRNNRGVSQNNKRAHANNSKRRKAA